MLTLRHATAGRMVQIPNKSHQLLAQFGCDSSRFRVIRAHSCPRLLYHLQWIQISTSYCLYCGYCNINRDSPSVSEQINHWPIENREIYIGAEWGLVQQGDWRGILQRCDQLWKDIDVDLWLDVSWLYDYNQVWSSALQVSARSFLSVWLFHQQSNSKPQGKRVLFGLLPEFIDHSVHYSMLICIISTAIRCPSFYPWCSTIKARCKTVCQNGWPRKWLMNTTSPTSACSNLSKLTSSPLRPQNPRKHFDCWKMIATSSLRLFPSYWTISKLTSKSSRWASICSCYCRHSFHHSPHFRIFANQNDCCCWRHLDQTSDFPRRET